ncbi:MAG: trypsin-like serine protease [Leptolinea sp.]|nr:trypsin-like serine protease [Leptolinea sp.]
MQKKMLIVVLLTLALSTIACQFGAAIPSRNTTANLPSIAPTSYVSLPISSANPNLIAEQDLLVRLYDAASPGVVLIQQIGDTGSGLGSGFVYDPNGYVVTNYHVVEGATDLEVDFSSGYKTRGTIKASDLDSDLAVIKVNAPADQLHPLVMGDSDQVKVGQTVVAIGNPFGLNNTMTMGIVSAKGRTMDSLRQTDDGNYYSTGDMIQTDASINPGNSGGPLLNLNGEVIGLNRSIRTNTITEEGDAVNSGIGFAVSVNIIKKVVPILIQKGHYDYPYLGISTPPGGDLSLLEREELGLSATSGAYLMEVVKGSPADQAGLVGGSKVTRIRGLLSGGDLIVAVDNRRVNVFGDLMSYIITNKSPGDSVVIRVIRDNKEKEFTLTLGKRP